MLLITRYGKTATSRCGLFCYSTFRLPFSTASLSFNLSINYRQGDEVDDLPYSAAQLQHLYRLAQAEQDRPYSFRTAHFL